MEPLFRYTGPSATLCICVWCDRPVYEKPGRASRMRFCGRECGIRYTLLIRRENERARSKHAEVPPTRTQATPPP